MGRAPCCDKSKVKKGPWSPDEDATLKSFIQQNGTGGNWIALPTKAGLKRCGKSCRLRWLNYLRPDIKHGGFTEHEDNIICTLYTTIGSRWSVIASQLQGRTDNDVKNYWNTKLKKKFLAGKFYITNKISASHNDPLPQIPEFETFNPANSPCFNSDSVNSNSIPSLIEIGDNFCNYSQQDLFLDQIQFGSPVPTAAGDDICYGSYSSSSPLTVPLEKNLTVAGDVGVPAAYFGFESLNYEQFNDVGFQEIKMCHYHY